ncbi:hypothetical protein ASU91_17350 [Enterobacter hormaechei subsp. steigerwaltii]|nr:hypothetical protein ASV27_24775 [Enterobacter hormaechei subsp. steigerwaltii]KTJ10175.1 hypothetical protein ASU91_17350 [Enterobacter hormaechei subsp. steigerwaltii]
MIHDGTTTDLTLISNMLIARPALALVTCVIGQFKQDQLTKRVAYLDLHRLDHQFHAHRTPRYN